MAKLTKTSRNQFILEDVKLRFKNFAGRKTDFNADGDRNFCVEIIDEDIVSELEALGINVKPMKKIDPDEAQRYYFKIKLKIRTGSAEEMERNPQIWNVTGTSNKALVPADKVSAVDSEDIAKADIQFRLYSSTVGGRTYTTAWLVKAYLILEEDYLDAKYADEEATYDDYFETEE